MKDPVVELRETDLYSSLLRDSPDFSTRIERLVVGLSPLLASTVRHFPYYTRHDAHHGYNVVRRIEQIVKPECFVTGGPASLAPSERFLLIAAAYAHDLGMTVFPGEESELLNRLGIGKTPGWETHPLLQNHLRAEHSRRGGKYIERHADALGIPIPLVSALDKMMRAHNFSIAELEKDLHLPYAAEAKEIDVRQLAVIVCVADALEFSDTRVVDGVIDQIMLDPSAAARTSYRENMKHVCVGESLAIRTDGSVLVSGTFSEEDVLALAHRTMDEIEGWVQGYCDVDRRSRQPRLLVKPIPFERNLNFTGGRFERLGVRLNKKNVIDLIASNAVWRDNRGVAIRELVQNAVEACRYREHHSSDADAYTPGVSVIFDRSDRSVSVSDNGCGMSERTVLNNFLTVGSSRSREPGYSQTDYAPIARFGIGFWSVFTIAEHAHIETAEYEPYRGSPAKSLAAEGFGFDVSLQELKEYTVFRPVVRPCGTTVKLKLRSDVVIDDVYALGLNTLLCSETPVTFVLDGAETHVPKRLPDISVRDVMGERSRVMDDHDVRLFRWRGEANGVEVSLGLAYRMENDKATFMANPTSSLMNVIGSYRHPRTSVCGFYAPIAARNICIDLNRIGNYFANRQSPAGIEFSLDRSGLQPNKASLDCADTVRDLIHAGYRAFLDETHSRDTATITSLREQAAMHGGNVYDTFTDIELMDAAKRFPDLLSARLYPVSADKGIDESAPVYVDLGGLRRLSGTVFFMQQQPRADVGPGMVVHMELGSLQAATITHAIVRAWMAAGIVREPSYVMAADRVGSMLFDADPESSVRFQQAGPALLCFQFADFSRMSFDAPPANIIAQVQGRWSGAVYERQFSTPDGKPYLFLGRHRVLVQRSTALAGHIANLATENRRIAIADVVADLQEDERGFTPDAISHLL
jgi:Histidine kinase-, DNA gyrase B-, and HSP90-like ATPase